MALNFRENGRTYLLIAVVTVLLIAPFVYLAVKKGNLSGKTSSTGEYYDKNSGETVSNPAGKAPENFGGTADHPVYLGFSKLLDIGVSKYQLEALKYAFEQYGKSSNQSPKEVSLTVDSIHSTLHNPSDPNSKDTVTFDVTLDRKQAYKAKVEYSDITAVRLYLSDPQTGSLIYDSKIVDRYSSDDYGGDGTPPEARPKQ